MQCTHCHTENRPGRRFCAECGAPLALPCAVCGFANAPGHTFGGGCGMPLTTAPHAPELRFA
jgi:adenylate cyclase